MKVLIAGASGAIGRPLIRCLRENRHAVTALCQRQIFEAESGY
jgi:nucleoside-diphosphate-sugar epimerase